jgi:hypothetical protein
LRLVHQHPHHLPGQAADLQLHGACLLQLVADLGAGVEGVGVVGGQVKGQAGTGTQILDGGDLRPQVETREIEGRVPEGQPVAAAELVHRGLAQETGVI